MINCLVVTVILLFPCCSKDLDVRMSKGLGMWEHWDGTGPISYLPKVGGKWAAACVFTVLTNKSQFPSGILITGCSFEAMKTSHEHLVSLEGRAGPTLQPRLPIKDYWELPTIA